MLGYWSSICAALVVLHLTSAEEYIAVFPKELRTGMTFMVDMMLLTTPANYVKVDVSIRTGTNISDSLAWNNSIFSLNFAAGTSYSKSEIMVPYSLKAGPMYYYIHMQFTGLTLDPVSIQVGVTQLKSNIFIQTDKGIYKPGDQVQWRVLNVDKDLAPKQEALHVQIKDAKDNVIMDKRADPSSGSFSALLSGDMTVSDDPILGTYTITAEADTEMVAAQFDVAEYVLPKFEVQLTLTQEYGVNGPDTMISGQVKAIYTYGQMVKGEMKLKMGDDIVKNIKNFDGMATFSVTIQGNIKQPFQWGYQSWSQTINVYAEVSEMHTMIKANDTKPFMLYGAAFGARFIKPLPYLNDQDKEYSFYVEVTDPMGGLLADWDTSVKNSQDPQNYVLIYQVTMNDYSSLGEQNVSVTTNPMKVVVPVNSNGIMAIKVWYVYKPLNGEDIQGLQAYENIPKYVTASGAGIKVTLLNGGSEGQKCFQMSPFRNGNVAFYQIINNYYPEDLQRYTNVNGHCFNVTNIHAPKSLLMVYKKVSYVENDTQCTELLVDFAMFQLPWTSNQQVAMTITPSTQKPGMTVDISVRTSGQSLLALSAVDKGTTLLAGSNDITSQKIVDAITKYNIFKINSQNQPIIGRGWIDKKKRSFGFYNSIVRITPSAKLKEAGLTILTNIPLYKENEVRNDIAVLAGNNKMEDNMIVASDVGASPTATQAPAVAGYENVRKNFNEIWLWELNETGPNGTLIFQKQVPDTITNWIVNAFAFNNIYGLGVAETKEVTVFQEFFISMNLPYSIVRTEIITLQMLVFNYKSTEITVTITMEEDAQFYVITDIGKKSQEITIGPGASGLAEVPIQAKVVGEILIRAHAIQKTDVSNRDSVERKLLVKPEGREVSHSTNLKITLPASTVETQFDLLSFFTEANYVVGSLRMYLRVTGDMMGPFIDNLEGRIQMPYGCGEQNIQSLTPAMFVAKYLKAINRYESDAKEKVEKACGTGYRNELTYRHKDGSFSAFGEQLNLDSLANVKGSTWLTAYVLKTFSLIAFEELTFVSRDILDSAYGYLYSVMEANCNDQFFNEWGDLIHTEMQGGTTSKIGFTAFCMIASMDYKTVVDKDQRTSVSQNVTNLLSSATKWLREKKSSLLQAKQPYQLAISAYALSRTSLDAGDLNSVAARDLLQELDIMDTSKQAPVDSACIAKKRVVNAKQCTRDNDCQQGDTTVWGYDNMACCSEPCGTTKICAQKPYPSYSHSGPSQIETYGYAMMAYLQLYSKETNATIKQQYKTKASEKMDWLLTQRKGNGFFQSTQDTAVALEALSYYAITFPESSTTNFRVLAKADGKVASDEIFLTTDNKTVNAEVKLSTNQKPKAVSVMVEGSSGTIFANLRAIYNLNDSNTNQPLLITIENILKDGLEFIRGCTKFNPSSSVNIGTMIVTTITLPTGCKYERLDTSNRQQLAPSRIEIDHEQNTVTTYFMTGEDGFKAARCFDLYYTRQFDVQNAQPGVAVAMDYYKQENNVEVLYSTLTSTIITTGASSIHLNMILLVAGLFSFLFFNFRNY